MSYVVRRQTSRKQDRKHLLAGLIQQLFYQYSLNHFNKLHGNDDSIGCVSSSAVMNGSA